MSGILGEDTQVVIEQKLKITLTTLCIAMIQMWRRIYRIKRFSCTRIVLINVASDKCRHSIADKQAYMTYKLCLNIIAEVYWLKIKTIL